MAEPDQQHQNDDLTDKFSTEFRSLNPQLDAFLDDWRDELYRKETILRLNEDCLYKVFSYLPAIDLCSLRGSCRDFRRIAPYCFERRSKWFCLDSAHVYGVPTKALQSKDAHFVIRNFGNFLTKLSVNRSVFRCVEDALTLLPSLDQHCINLQDLTLDIFHSNPVPIIQDYRLVSNLHRLVIKGHNEGEEITTEVDVITIVARCPLLKQLELFKFITNFGVVGQKYCEGHLESLWIENCLIPNAVTFRDFLSHNLQLKKVKISLGSRAVLEMTLPQLPMLESLCIRTKGLRLFRPLNPLFMTNCVHTLQKLQVDMHCVAEHNLYPLLSDLSACNKIEHLHILRNGFMPDDDRLIRHLAALKTLKTLTITLATGLNADVTKKLACQLSGLEEIEFKACFEATTFESPMKDSAIENFIANSNNVKRIVFFRGFEGVNPIRMTEAVFLALVNARRRNKRHNVPLLLFLDETDFIDGHFQEKGMAKSLARHADVIKLLPYSINKANK